MTCFCFFFLNIASNTLHRVFVFFLDFGVVVHHPEHRACRDCPMECHTSLPKGWGGERRGSSVDGKRPGLPLQAAGTVSWMECSRTRPVTPCHARGQGRGLGGKAVGFGLQILPLRVCKQSQVYVNEGNNSEVSP